MSSSRIYKNRDLYLNKLIAFQDTEPVKVVTGIRRCGKSSLLKLMIQHLLDTSVYLDTAYTLGDITPIDNHYAPDELPMLADERFCELVRIFGSKRVLFGTDSPWDNMQQCVQRIRNLPLTDAEKDDIFCRNASRLLSL